MPEDIEALLKELDNRNFNIHKDNNRVAFFNIHIFESQDINHYDWQPIFESITHLPPYCQTVNLQYEDGIFCYYQHYVFQIDQQSQIINRRRNNSYIVIFPQQISQNYQKVVIDETEYRIFFDYLGNAFLLNKFDVIALNSTAVGRNTPVIRHFIQNEQLYKFFDKELFQCLTIYNNKPIYKKIKQFNTNYIYTEINQQHLFIKPIQSDISQYLKEKIPQQIVMSLLNGNNALIHRWENKEVHYSYSKQTAYFIDFTDNSIIQTPSEFFIDFLAGHPNATSLEVQQYLMSLENMVYTRINVIDFVKNTYKTFNMHSIQPIASKPQYNSDFQGMLRDIKEYRRCDAQKIYNLVENEDQLYKLVKYAIKFNQTELCKIINSNYSGNMLLKSHTLYQYCLKQYNYDLLRVFEQQHKGKQGLNGLTNLQACCMYNIQTIIQDFIGEAKQQQSDENKSSALYLCLYPALNKGCRRVDPFLFKFMFPYEYMLRYSDGNTIMMLANKYNIRFEGVEEMLLQESLKHLVNDKNEYLAQIVMENSFANSAITGVILSSQRRLVHAHPYDSQYESLQFECMFNVQPDPLTKKDFEVTDNNGGIRERLPLDYFNKPTIHFLEFYDHKKIPVLDIFNRNLKRLTHLRKQTNCKFGGGYYEDHKLKKMVKKCCEFQPHYKDPRCVGVKRVIDSKEDAEKKAKLQNILRHVLDSNPVCFVNDSKQRVKIDYFEEIVFNNDDEEINTNQNEKEQVKHILPRRLIEQREVDPVDMEFGGGFGQMNHQRVLNHIFNNARNHQFNHDRRDDFEDDDSDDEDNGDYQEDEEDQFDFVDSDGNPGHYSDFNDYDDDYY